MSRVRMPSVLQAASYLKHPDAVLEDVPGLLSSRVDVGVDRRHCDGAARASADGAPFVSGGNASECEWAARALGVNASMARRVGALICAAAEEALDIPGVEVVRVPLNAGGAVDEADCLRCDAGQREPRADLPPAAPWSNCPRARGTPRAARRRSVEACRGYDAAGCAQAEVVLATRAAAARWARASVGRGADHSFWPPFFNYEGGSGS